MGSPLFSFTTRETTALYWTCFNANVPQLVDILADVVQNALLNEPELEKVKRDVLREHNEIEANIETVLMDYLHSTAYQGTPLAQNILG